MPYSALNTDEGAPQVDTPKHDFDTIIPNTILWLAMIIDRRVLLRMEHLWTDRTAVHAHVTVFAAVLIQGSYHHTLLITLPLLAVLVSR